MLGDAASGAVVWGGAPPLPCNSGVLTERFPLYSSSCSNLIFTLTLIPTKTGDQERANLFSRDATGAIKIWQWFWSSPFYPNFKKIKINCYTLNCGQKILLTKISFLSKFSFQNLLVGILWSKPKTVRPGNSFLWIIEKHILPSLCAHSNQSVCILWVER